MFHAVLKPFNTANRRLKPGDGPGGRMSTDDVFEPFTLPDLISRKFLGEAEEELVAVSGIDGGADTPAADVGTLDIRTSPAKEGAKDSQKAAPVSAK